MERSFCFSLFFLFFRLVWAKIFCAWDLMILSFFYMLPCVQELVKFLKTHEYSPSTLPCGIPWGMAGFSMEWLSWSIRGHKVLFLGSRKCLPSWLWDADRERGLLLRCRCDSLLWMTLPSILLLAFLDNLQLFQDGVSSWDPKDLFLITVGEEMVGDNMALGDPSTPYWDSWDNSVTWNQQMFLFKNDLKCKSSEQ